MENTYFRTLQELQQIVSLLETTTGLTSRWSGKIELIPDADFKGKNRFGVIFFLMPT